MKLLELEDGEFGIILAALLDFKNSVEHQSKDPKVGLLVTALVKNFGMDSNFTMGDYLKMINDVIEKVKKA